MVMADMLPLLVLEMGRSGESGEKDHDTRLVVFMGIPVSTAELGPLARMVEYGASIVHHSHSPPHPPVIQTRILRSERLRFIQSLREKACPSQCTRLLRKMLKAIK